MTDLVSQNRDGDWIFDHMLTLFAKHALIDFEVFSKGDLRRFHHTIEIYRNCTGQAIAKALGSKNV